MNKKSEKNKQIKVENASENVIQEKEKNNKIKNYYIGYGMRVLICTLLFFLTIGLSFFFFTKTINIEEAEIVKYQETGTMDYKVYLKPNEFYETPYLEKDMYYIASLIENVNVDINYQFMIDEAVDSTITYDIIGKLTIASDQGANKLYEKEYVLKKNQSQTVTGQTLQSISDNLVIDYDYYNELANRFKSTYGVDADSDLTVYVRFNKDAKNEVEQINIVESSEMSLTIPLTQKTLDIKINNTGINNTKNIVKESKVTLVNIFSGILCFVLFVTSVGFILKTLELLFLLFPKKSKYDSYVKKILNEYDRLIVETPTEPRLNDKEIIQIKKFNELLDARDNLKRPIMYHNLINHQKCYFYIEKDDTVYLLVIKAVDLEEKKEKNK